MGEKAVYATHAHVFQIDPETKKKWLPSSASAVRVAYYHDPARRTYRIIAIESNKALVNSTITANMNFTKTSPKFGQWSDHRANTVYGLGFSSEKDLNLFVDKFMEAKAAAKVLLDERKKAAQRVQDADRPQPPAGVAVMSPTTSPPFTSPPAIPTLPPPHPSPDADSDREQAAMNGTIPQDMNGMSTGESSPSLSHAPSSMGHTPSNLASLSPEAQIEALKYENSKLKVALASSAQNVKKWESEMQTLKNNNTRLTTALEESTQHVSEWRRQLGRYKDECEQLKAKVREAQSSEELEGMRKENDELKEVLSSVQLDLEAKTEEMVRREGEMRTLSDQLEEAKSKLHSVELERNSLSEQVAVVEDQLKMASLASQRKMSEVAEKHRELGSCLDQALRLHRDAQSLCNT